MKVEKNDNDTKSTPSFSAGDQPVSLYNIKAEQDILGAILFDNNNINIVSDFLREWHFYEPIHGKLFGVVSKLIEKGRVADPTSLENHFANDEGFKTVGSSKYLFDLVARFAGVTYGIVNIVDRAKIVYDLYIRRKLIEISRDRQTEILKQNSLISAENHVEMFEEKLFALANESISHGRGFISLQQSVAISLEHIKKAKEMGGISGISTGFVDMDRYLSGWHDSDLVIIAGRPSMGKTAFAISIALNAAIAIEEQGKTDPKKKGVVAVFSLEMSSEQLATRILSTYSGFGTDELIGGKFEKSDMANIIEAAEQFQHLPMYIDDTPAISVTSLRTRCRRLQRQHGLRMIIVDYLQLLKGSGKAGGGYENRVQEISEITQSLKAIAKELNIPVIALSQLSRSVESREDKHPQLQDLRESGSIEQDADIVMFIYREAYYLARTRPNEVDVEAMNEWNAKHGEKWLKVQNKTEIIIGKHRNGPIGTVTLFFNESTTRFENIVYENSSGSSGY